MDSGGVSIGLAGDGGREMEGLTPNPVVNVSDKVVEGVDESGDFLGCLNLLGAAEEGLVLFVLVLDFLFIDRVVGELDDVLPFLFGGEGEGKEEERKKEKRKKKLFLLQLVLAQEGKGGRGGEREKKKRGKKRKKKEKEKERKKKETKKFFH